MVTDITILAKKGLPESAAQSLARGTYVDLTNEDIVAKREIEYSTPEQHLITISDIVTF